MKRSSPLKRTADLKQRTPIRRVSARRRKRDAVYPERRRQVYERDEGCCRRCRLFLLPDIGHVHHLAGRGGRDPHRLEGLVLLCPACHEHVHRHPAESYDQGWMVRRLGGAT